MFEFKVQSLFGAHAEIGDRWPTKIVTLIGGMDEHLIPSMGDHHHITIFDDIEIDQAGDWKAAKIEQIESVFDFTKSFSADDRVLVHCRAGKSRSTAMMIGILVQHGMSPEDAFEAVKEARPALIPNRLIIAFIDQILGLDGALNEVIAAYYKRLTIPGVHLPDRGGANL